MKEIIYPQKLYLRTFAIQCNNLNYINAMQRSYLILIIICCSIYGVAQEQGIPVPKHHQLKWHEAEMGAVFHYDLHVFDGIRYGQGNNRINPIEDYNIFNRPMDRSRQSCRM